MKKFIWCLVAFLSVAGITAAQGYYCGGPGMMYGDWNNNSNNGYYCDGPGMMYGNWGNSDWHKSTQSSLNLTQEQKNQWNNVTTQSQPSQQAINDSINYYVSQVQRLQKNRSSLVQSDLNRIKGILTPAQYTQFLEKLVAGDQK